MLYRVLWRRWLSTTLAAQAQAQANLPRVAATDNDLAIAAPEEITLTEGRHRHRGRRELGPPLVPDSISSLKRSSWDVSPPFEACSTASYSITT